MIIADIFVNSSSATAEIHDLLPRGASGLKVRFHFADSEWNHLSKTAVFRNGNITMDAVVTDNCAAIPREILAKVMDPVEVGIYGTNGDRALEIPTVWCKLGNVASAANPSGNTSAERTLPYWAQIKEQVDIVQSRMMDQEDLENALAQAKESGDFKGEKGDRGETGPQGIQGDKGEKGDPGDVHEAPPIVCEATGEEITLDDSTERPLRGLNLFGKTIQNGTPTPRTPVPLESVGTDGSVTIHIGDQSLIVQTPNGLPGIPVSTGGNYTDENGQQWICDEIDFANGKYVRRVGQKTITSIHVTEGNSTGETKYMLTISPITDMMLGNWLPGLCNVFKCGYLAKEPNAVRFGANNTTMYVYADDDVFANKTSANAWFAEHPMVIEYVLANPIKTDLIAEEIAQYSALHTNYPNTTIYNDSGAGLGVAYVADTKKYIDKKFAELATAILNA